MTKWLGENIGKHNLRRHVDDDDHVALDKLARVVIGESDMLGRRLGDGVVDHADRTLAIAVELDGAYEGAQTKEFGFLGETDGLAPSLGRSSSLRVVGAGGDTAVALGVPRDRGSRSVEEKDVSSGAAQSIRAVGVSGVEVADDTGIGYGLAEVV